MALLVLRVPLALQVIRVRQASREQVALPVQLA